MKCTKCGNTSLKYGMEKVGEFNGTPVMHKFAYCYTCMSKYDLDMQNNIKKKDSELSIIACVFAIFTCTFPIAIILALIDLGINNKEKKHMGSWFALVWGAIALILVCSGAVGKNLNTSQTNPIRNESSNFGSSTTGSDSKNTLFQLTSNYKNMKLSDIAKVDNCYITLNHIKRVDTIRSIFGAEKIDSSHEVLIGFFEFYNESDKILSLDQSEITAYADDVKVEEVKSFFLFSEDGVDKLHNYDIDSNSACMLIVNFEVPKDWNNLQIYYKSECVWSFSTDEITGDAYDGKKILAMNHNIPSTSVGTSFTSGEIEIVYDGFELYKHENVVFGDETYIVYKYTLTNKGTSLYENSLVGYKMRGYCNNYLLDDATYTMDDKIGDYMNIYELKEIQANKSMHVYVAFEVDGAKTETEYYMAFDMGYIISKLENKIYVSTQD